MTSPASDAIRASIEALPYQARVTPWQSSGSHIRCAEGYPVTHPSAGWLLLEQDAIAAHIATLASPDVAQKLADLLDAIHPRGHGAGYDCDAACMDDVNEAKAALEAAILRSDR